MKKILSLTASIFLSITIAAQNYERNPICGTDTITVNSVSMKLGDTIRLKAFECTQISKFGLRLDVGFNHFSYNAKTKNWLGNHNGALVGLALVWGDLNFGIKFKIATIKTNSELDVNGVQLPLNTQLNPVKVNFDIGYSINLKHNFSIEPFLAMTYHDFIILNEDGLGKEYDINKLWAPIVGTTINKYFPLSNRQFISIFVRYGYGFANFRKVHQDLGFGYSDISEGIGLKGFMEKSFLKRL